MLWFMDNLMKKFHLNENNNFPHYKSSSALDTFTCKYSSGNSQHVMCETIAAVQKIIQIYF